MTGGRKGQGVDDATVLARAYLNRVAEPANLPMWTFVRDLGPLAAAQRIRARDRLPDRVASATAARADRIDPHADLDAAARHGIRLVVPESPDWPHFAIAALEHSGRTRELTFDAEPNLYEGRGEPVPPLALWVRGPLDLAPIGTRSAGVVGSRGASDYGKHVAFQLAAALAENDVVVVSGGALGIDGAAHRGALARQGGTVLVSAGGLDAAYPSQHADLFRSVAGSGLLVSESPPGAAPARHRFLTRNRLIAAFSAGTVVVEAARRSGALNTISHCHRLGRPIMAVPGSVESALSVGCHDVLRNPAYAATLVAGAADVLEAIGAGAPLGEVETADPAGAAHAGAAPHRRRVLDGLDERTRRVFDGFPAARAVPPDDLAVASGLPVGDVLCALPTLELAGLVEQSDGLFRIRR